jgi:two-component system response regulator DesR
MTLAMVLRLLAACPIAPGRSADRRGVRAWTRHKPELPGEKEPMALRLLLVEDHAAFRGALRFVLNLRPGTRVVAECGSLAECRALGDRLRAIDLALLDLMLPDGDGTELIAVLRGANPEVKVLILSASIEPGLRERVTEAGADGVLNKATPLTGIVSEVGRLAGAARA